MRPFVRNLAVAMAFSLGLVTTAFGQSVGDEVVVITEKADLKNEATVVETTSRGGYYKVRAVNGNWLSISHGGTVGWVSRGDVILANRALDHFTNELRRNPKDATALIARSLAWKDRGELTNAIRDCTDAIAINPEYSWGFQIRGLAWKAKKEFDLAISDFEEGIRLSPKHDALYLNRGSCYHDKKNFEKAIADFTEAIRLNPKDAVNYERRGDSLVELKQDTKALSDFTMAIELDSKRAGAFASRAALFESQGLFAKSLKDRESAVSADPRSATEANNLAWLLATCGDDQIRDGHRAIEVAIKAVELENDRSGKAMIRDTLAAAYAETGDFAKAVEIQKLALADIDAENKAQLEEHLKLFEAGKPYREIAKTEATTTTAAK